MRAVPYSLLLLSSLAGCGDNLPASPDAGPDAPADECTVIELGARDFQSNLFGQLTGVRYEVSPGLDGAPPESLFVELYDSTTPDLPPLTTGTFRLGVAPNDDLATCQHCVWLPVDWDGESPLERVFIATEGTLTLTEVTDPLEIVFAGETSEVVLREATVDETGATTLVDDGRCLRAAPIAFDTNPTPGQACLSAEDCGNPLLEVCSPATNTCTAPECIDFGGCPDDRPVCITQYGSSFDGACYAACNPSGPETCASGQTCSQPSADRTFGVCLQTGTGTLDAACELEDNTTSCVAGLTCSPEREVCTSTCDVYAAEPGCQAGTACTVLGLCEPIPSGDDAELGEPCDPSSMLAEGCAADGGAFRGICFAYEPNPLVCEKACFGDLGCAPEEFCALRFTTGLGICLPDPVCGDGQLGEIDEVCDDGNTVSGDGCSADCGTVEYGPICTGATVIVGGTSTMGNTTIGWDGFQSSCQAGIARGDVYRFAPPSRGRLRVAIQSPTVHTISVRSTCDDGGTELGCSDTQPFGQPPEIIVQVTDPTEDLTVLVSAYNVLEQGAYTLDTEFVAESCGDGIVAGLEVCDDGNTDSNDGCRADCLEIEYDVYCAEAPALTAGTPLTGDNTGAPNVHEATCSNSIFGSGPERLYTYTAPAAGRVRFTLDQGNQDLALAVFDACGAPSAMTELACSSVSDPEVVEVPVTAGQTVTILVEGFSAGDAGPFTLSAELLPP